MTGADRGDRVPQVRPSMPTPCGDVDVVLQGARHDTDGVSLAAVALIGALAVGLGWLGWHTFTTG